MPVTPEEGDVFVHGERAYIYTATTDGGRWQDAQDDPRVLLGLQVVQALRTLRDNPEVINPKEKSPEELKTKIENMFDQLSGNPDDVDRQPDR